MKIIYSNNNIIFLFFLILFGSYYKFFFLFCGIQTIQKNIKIISNGKHHVILENLDAKIQTLSSNYCTGGMLGTIQNLEG